MFHIAFHVQKKFLGNSKKIPNIFRFSGKVIIVRNLLTPNDVICGGCDDGNLTTVAIGYYCVVVHEEKKNNVV
jgi:hypothetical protein